MSQTKNCNLANLPSELLPLISHELRDLDEVSRSDIALSGTIFGKGAFQEERLRLRLVQYLVQGQLDMVGSLLKIKPDFESNLPDVFEKALFILAGSAEQDKMEPLLKRYPQLLLSKRPLRDISGAYFEKITLLQHAVWAGDVRYMCGMFLDCLPQNALGEQIRLDLLRQFKELMASGTTYILNGKERQEQQFSIAPLLDALRNYEANYFSWTEDEKNNYWCTVIGGIQQYLTAHFRHHYCDPEESFNHKPSFTKQTLVRSLEIGNFYVSNDGNWIRSRPEDMWVSELPGLGSKFGIIGKRLGVELSPPLTEIRAHYAGDAQMDLDALETLSQVRTNIDLPALVTRLETPIAIQQEHLSLSATTS